MNTKLLGFIITFVLLAIFAFCIKQTNLQLIFKDVKWTDIGSLFITLTGLVFAIVTYSRWWTNKKNEDIHAATKFYLVELSTIRQLVMELTHEYSCLIPLPGSMCEPDKKIISRIERCIDLQMQLNHSSLSFPLAEEQLGFWGASLSPNKKILHEELLGEIRQASFYADINNRNLQYLYFSDKDDYNKRLCDTKEQFDRFFLLGSAVLEAYRKLAEGGFNKIFKL